MARLNDVGRRIGDVSGDMNELGDRIGVLMGGLDSVDPRLLKEAWDLLQQELLIEHQPHGVWS